MNTTLNVGEKFMSYMCNLLARNLGKPLGQLCPISTPFDEELAECANSFFVAHSYSRGCGLEGEPSCEEVDEWAKFNQRKIADLSEKRNEHLKKIKSIPSYCFLTPQELESHFHIEPTNNS
jgi:hypothetical protein